MVAVCTEEPMAKHGLEGYVKGQLYKVEMRSIKRKKYYRVYHTRHYWECIGPRIFNKFFEIKEEADVRTGD